jgi:hypothetical protein
MENYPPHLYMNLVDYAGTLANPPKPMYPHEDVIHCLETARQHMECELGITKTSEMRTMSEMHDADYDKDDLVGEFQRRTQQASVIAQRHKQREEQRKREVLQWEKARLAKYKKRTPLGSQPEKRARREE